MYIFIANLHAITVAEDPTELKRNTKDLIALYLACGLDPQSDALFAERCASARRAGLDPDLPHFTWANCSG